MPNGQYLSGVIGSLMDAINREPRYSQNERVVDLIALCGAAQLLQGLEETLMKSTNRAEIALGLAGMVIAERDDLSAAFELGRQAGLDEAAKHTSVQVALPEMPDPEDCEHLSFDAYSGSQMLAYGRVCAEAQRMMPNGGSETTERR